METCEECGRPDHAGGGRDAEAHCYGDDTVDCLRHALTRERATVERLTEERDRAVRHSTDMESRMWAAVTRAEAAEARERALREACALVPDLVARSYRAGMEGVVYRRTVAVDLDNWLTTLPAEAPETTEAAPGREESDDA